MKSQDLFDLLPGELVNIVDFAFDIYKTEKRSPRIAINANSWWNINLTAAAVQAIRDRSDPSDNPIERNILFYTLQILEWGIELHFVFDSPKWAKNEGNNYPGHDLPSDLLRKALTDIGVPWHDAPASAEAECVEMEKERIVDAVWSEDGHALAFGCRTLIKSFHKIQSSTAAGEKKIKSHTQFRVYRIHELVKEYPGMDRDGFMFHAIFNQDSRPGSYLQLDDLLEAANRGLARSLCATRTVRELQAWTMTKLSHFLKEIGRNNIPRDFPKWHHLQKYRAPEVSRPRDLSNLPSPPDPFQDEEKLYNFLSKSLQITLNQWVTYILPHRIVRSLIHTKEGTENQHDNLNITCTALKPKRNALSPNSKKIPKSATAEFVPRAATSINISSLFLDTTKLETMVWILRKSNYNRQPSIVSLWSPNANQNGRGTATSISRPRQKLLPAGGVTLPSPLATRSNGEGPSGTNANRAHPNRAERQHTPPSPTPIPALPRKKRQRQRDAGKQADRVFKVSKVTRGPASSKDSGNRKGKEKEKELSAPPSSNSARSQTLENDSPRSQTLKNDISVDDGEGGSVKDVLTPMSSLTVVADVDYIMIDSD